jgi:hypothetical protein
LAAVSLLLSESACPLPLPYLSGAASLLLSE